MSAHSPQTFAVSIKDADPSQVLRSLENLSEQLTTRTRSELVEEITELCQFALGIEIALQEATKIVNAVINPDNAMLLNPVLDALSACKKQYNATLEESLLVADKAHEAGDKFAQLYKEVLSKDDTSTEQKKEAIANYISTLDIEAKQADNLVTYYKDLRSQIATYFKAWNLLTDFLGLELPHDVAQVDKDIASYTGTITRLDTEVNTHVLDYSLAFSPSGVTTSLVSFCAKTYTRSVCDAVKLDGLGDVLINAKREREGAQSSLNDQILKRRLLEADLKAFEALIAIVADIDVAFEKIIHIFDMITSTWANIRSDLQSISHQLDLVHDTVDKELLNGRMKTAVAMYEALSAALSQYKNTSVPPILQ